MQHAAYVAALRDLGVVVKVLPPAEEEPDACFVEDQAVVYAGIAVITRCGHPARRPEAGAIADALAVVLPLVRMEAPATLDGGDVLPVGRTLFVGRSRRTNAAGIAFLREVMAPRGIAVREVPVPAGTLHLQSVCSALDDDTVLLARGTVPAVALPGVARILEVPAEEAYAANAVAVGEDVLLPAGYPVTARRVAEAGYRVHPLPMDAFRAADGALTCLSLRW